MLKLISELKVNSELTTFKTIVRGSITIIRPVNVAVLLVTMLTAYYLLELYTNYSVPALIHNALPWLMVLAAGNVINDIYDYGVDRLRRPGRALPLGLLTLNNAKVLYTVIVLLSLYVSFTFSIISFLLVLFFHQILFFYSAYLKQTRIIGNVLVAAATACSFFYCALSFGISLQPIIVPSVFAFLLNFARELIKDLEDAETDLLYGIVTFAQVNAGKASRILATILLIAVIILVFYVYFTEWYAVEFFFVCCISVNPLAVLQIKYLLSNNIRVQNGTVSKYLKIIMAAGLGALLLTH